MGNGIPNPAIALTPPPRNHKARAWKLPEPEAIRTLPKIKARIRNPDTTCSQGPLVDSRGQY